MTKQNSPKHHEIKIKNERRVLSPGELQCFTTVYIHIQVNTHQVVQLLNFLLCCKGLLQDPVTSLLGVVTRVAEPSGNPW